MPKRSSKGPPEDPNQAAADAVRRLTESEDDDPSEAEKNAAAALLGRLGGKKGGPARAANLSPERRAEIARMAAAARWEKHRNNGE